MADVIPSRSRSVTREELAQVFKTPKLLRAFEAMSSDLNEVLPANIQMAVDAAAQAASSAAAAISAASDADSAALAADIHAQQAQAVADQALALATEEASAPSLGAVMAELQSLRSRVAALEQGKL